MYGDIEPLECLKPKVRHPRARTLPSTRIKDKVAHHTCSSAQSSASRDADVEGRGQERTQDRKKFNSTSSIYVTSTLTVPNTTKLLTNMSHLLNAQICANRAEQENSGQALKTDIFDETCWMNLDYTDQQHVPTPKAHDIYLFLASMFNVVMFSPECNVISLVYLNRLSQSACHQVVINHLNWRTVILSTFMVAQKVWDDKPLINVDFGLVWRRIVPQSKARLTIEAINAYERAVLKSLQFDLLISSSQYAKYYFELRDFITEDKDFPLKPISVNQAAKLEATSRNYQLREKLYSMSLDLEEATRIKTEPRMVIS